MEATLTVPLVTVIIDGLPVQVPKGMNMIEAAALIKKEIPHFCYHPKLSVAGNCRMCLVESGMPAIDRATNQVVLDEHGKPRINWAAKPAIACGMQACEGLHINTQTPMVKKCQEGVMEFLLLNHPLDCPICDQAGECKLQEFATDYGRGYSRSIDEKNVKPKHTVLGPRVILDDERCILCSRCVRFCKEIVHDDVLGFTDRGSHSMLACFPGKTLDNNYSLNTVDICPVGALTSTDFRFKMRVWFLKRTHSICTESSVGVNTEVWSREGVIYRITPRRNDYVNDTWMSDSGRLLYQQVTAANRLLAYKVNGALMSFQQAIEATIQVLKTGSVAYVLSGHGTVEEYAVLKQVVQTYPGPVYGIAQHQTGDTLLISNDATPNIRGALAVQLIKQEPQTHFEALSQAISSGTIKTLVCYRSDIKKLGLSNDQLNQISLILLDTHLDSELEQIAYAVIPVLTVFERSGTFINQQFRLQKFDQAIPGPELIQTDLTALYALLAYEQPMLSIVKLMSTIWDQLTTQYSIFKSIHWNTLPDLGVALNASDFDAITFCEGSSLHYKSYLKGDGVCS